MVFSALVIIFLFLKSWGQVPILRSIQYVTFKYGDFQKASRISLREPSRSIMSIHVNRECRSKHKRAITVQQYKTRVSRSNRADCYSGWKDECTGWIGGENRLPKKAPKMIASPHMDEYHEHFF